MTDPLTAARDAYRRHDWVQAHALFTRVSPIPSIPTVTATPAAIPATTIHPASAARAAPDARTAGFPSSPFPLADHRDSWTADDFAALGDAASWLGRVEEANRASEQAYHRYLRDGAPRHAAMAAIVLANNFFRAGSTGIGSGWMRRAQRLLADQPADCVEQGYLRYLAQVEGALDGPDLGSVLSNARQVRELGLRHDDRNLVAAGTLGEGRALVRQGRVAEGMALLDEAMLAVRSERLAPQWAGTVCCHGIAACAELVDYSRAEQWTAATEQWLRGLPAAVLFTGICRVHRAHLLCLSGVWDQAESEARRVCAELNGIHLASVAEAHYQIGEIRRLRGDVAAAEEAYRQAHRCGRDPQPGLALLRLAQGRARLALTSIREALTAPAHHRLARARLCAALVEIALAAGDNATARRGVDELAETAATYRSPGLEALAGQARGALLLAEGQPGEALGVLRTACRRWQEMAARYEVARIRLLLAVAYDGLSDQRAANLERDAATAMLDEIGTTQPAPDPPDGLTPREVQVIGMVATGRTNREIAAALRISEKTVARHLSNIFTKVGVSSRTAVTSYAFEHGLAWHG